MIITAIILFIHIFKWTVLMQIETEAPSDQITLAINRLSNGNLTREIKSLSQRTFDIHHENEHLHLLSQCVREMQNDFDSCREELSDVQSKIAIHRSELSDVQLKLVICQRPLDQKEVTKRVPHHIRGNHMKILENWKRNKLLLMCRKSVYISAVSKQQGLSSVKVIDLESIENRLENEEKRRILQKHSDTMSVPKNKYEQLSIENASIMFLFLCKLFAGNGKYQSIGERIFRKPFGGLCEEFDIMQERKTVNCAALIKCIISNNCLSIGRLLEEKTEVHIYNSVGLNQGTEDRLLQGALEQMIGTYVVEIEDQFSFIHDSLFDILAYHYGKRMKYYPEMIKYLPCKCISNIVYIDSNHSVDEFSIQIPEDQFNSLAERLFTDIQNLKLYEVFMMKLLYHEPFVRAFIEMLNKESYDSLKNVFLSAQENATCEHPDHIDKIIHNLLADLAFFVFEEERYCTRVISWVVYFGHFQLLQYIMDRVHDEEGSYQSVFDSEKMEHTRLLVLCCYRNDEKMTRLLLDHLDLDCINENLLTNNMLNILPNAHRTHTPLTAACEVGNLPIVKLLVQSGPEIKENDPNILLSLFLARYYGHTEIVDFLLSINKQRIHLSGKDPQIERDIRDRKVNMKRERSEKKKRKRNEKRKRENNQFCKARETVSIKSRKHNAAIQGRISQMTRWAEREYNKISKQNFRTNSQGNSKIATRTTKSKTVIMQVDGDGMVRCLVKGIRRGNNRRRQQKQPKSKRSKKNKSRDYSC